MYSVDLPRDGAGGDVLPDVVRIVASDNDECRPDHPVLLARHLPVGTTVDAEEATSLWRVSLATPTIAGTGR
jgi:hypothetical protein